MRLNKLKGVVTSQGDLIHKPVWRLGEKLLRKAEGSNIIKRRALHAQSPESRHQNIGAKLHASRCSILILLEEGICRLWARRASKYHFMMARKSSMMQARRGNQRAHWHWSGGIRMEACGHIKCSQNI